MKIIILYLLMAIYNLTILAGLIYVLDKGWSNWWIVLALLLLGGNSIKTKAENK